MNNVTFEIINKDKRFRHTSKIKNYIIDSCIKLGWYYSIVIENSTNLEIELEKDYGSNRVTFRINVMHLQSDKIVISIDKTSFYNYGINSFMKFLLSQLDITVYTRMISDKKEKTNVQNSDQIINKIFSNFHRSSQQLLKRHDDRDTLIINDEYDVQDYLHSLLLLFFDDVRDEDPLPKKAGASSRGDFFLPKEGILIETKISSDKNKDKEIGEQIIVDIKRYTANKDIKKIYFFVYNPNYKIKNPSGLENDLTGDKNIDVVVKVFPK